VFTARYELSSYIKQTRFVFKGLNANENTRNNKELSADNRRLIHDMPSYENEVGVWCDVIVIRVIGITFLDTVNPTGTVE
jgi:hypothetical protein